jgi:hypothetical protein
MSMKQVLCWRVLVEALEVKCKPNAR